MLPVSFQILLRNARPAAVWAGQGGFLVAFLQMLLGFCVLEIFRASLALEHCLFQHFHNQILDAICNEGVSAMWAISFAYLLTFPVRDALIAVDLVAFAALDHVLDYVRAN